MSEARTDVRSAEEGVDRATFLAIRLRALADSTKAVLRAAMLEEAVLEAELKQLKAQLKEIQDDDEDPATPQLSPSTPPDEDPTTPPDDVDHDSEAGTNPEPAEPEPPKRPAKKGDARKRRRQELSGKYRRVVCVSRFGRWRVLLRIAYLSARFRRVHSSVAPDPVRIGPRINKLRFAFRVSNTTQARRRRLWNSERVQRVERRRPCARATEDRAMLILPKGAVKPDSVLLRTLGSCKLISNH